MIAFVAAAPRDLPVPEGLDFAGVEVWPKPDVPNALKHTLRARELFDAANPRDERVDRMDAACWPEFADRESLREQLAASEPALRELELAIVSDPLIFAEGVLESLSRCFDSLQSGAPTAIERVLVHWQPGANLDRSRAGFSACSPRAIRGAAQSGALRASRCPDEPRPIGPAVARGLRRLANSVRPGERTLRGAGPSDPKAADGPRLELIF